MRNSADPRLDRPGPSDRNRKEIERVLKRVRSKLLRKLEEKPMSQQEAIAIQLEIDGEELQEWRARMMEIRAKSKDA